METGEACNHPSKLSGDEPSAPSATTTADNSKEADDIRTMLIVFSFFSGPRCSFHLHTANVNNDFYALDTDSLTWSRLSSFHGEPPCPRYAHSMAVWGSDRLVVFGGCDSSDEDMDDVHIVNLSTMTWEKVQVHGKGPGPRHCHSATIHDDKMYIHGGQSARTSTCLDDLNILDLNTFQWSGPVKVAFRNNHYSFIYRNCFYIYGGTYGTDKLEYVDDIASVDLDDFQASTLSLTSRNCPPALGRRFVQHCGDKLVILNSPLAPRPEELKPQVRSYPTGVWSLNLNNFQWKRHDEKLSCLDQGSWHYCTMSPHGSQIFLMGISNASADEMDGYDEHVDDYFGWLLKINVGSVGVVSVPSSTMHTDFARLAFTDENDPTKDFAIYSQHDPRPIRVHTLILHARWPHLSAVLRSGMAESVQASITLPEPRDSLLGFVQYLYTDSLEGLADDVVADLMAIGHVYCLERLQKLACAKLHRGLAVHNVARAFVGAIRAGETGLKQRAMSLILEKFGEVCRTPGFRNLARAEMDELLDCVPMGAGMALRGASRPRRTRAAVAAEAEADNEGDPEGDPEGDADMDAEVDMDAETDAEEDS
ncbi:hypothetical protein HDU96_000370 [Phlyctochytrium bullatum]|nr:hypothetical protein HDU96_000370 [Phlyctochytrium bullatum]